MKTTIRSHHAAIAILEQTALLCLTFVFTGCKREAHVRAERWPEPQRERADNGGQLMAIENRTEIAIVETEERLLVETIETSKAGSALTAQTENFKEAVRALGLEMDRYKAGAGTQIDLLNAQTALTEACISYVDALRDYSVARATLPRDTGADLQH